MNSEGRSQLKDVEALLQVARNMLRSVKWNEEDSSERLPFILYEERKAEISDNLTILEKSIGSVDEILTELSQLHR